jgi:hypothetical protein
MKLFWVRFIKLLHAKFLIVNFLWISATLFCASVHAATKIVGYLPTYKNMTQVIDATDLKKLTLFNNKEIHYENS